MNDQLLEQALNAREAGNYELAEKLYQQYLDKNPDDGEALRELALLTYGIFKNYTKAKQLIEQSIEVEDCAVGHFYLALILDRLEMSEQAGKEFEYSIKESGGDVMMHSMYGDILAAQGSLDKATSHFLAALSKEPDYEPAQKSYANLLEILKQNEHPKV